MDALDGAGMDSNGESLLLHRAFVRRLARDLARDGDEAAELEQETWLAALRHGERAQDAGWLARAMRGLARSRRRGGWRREARERSVARLERDAREEDPQALALRLEASQRLVQAVLALDEPQRTVVLLRYEGGLDSNAIAERSAIPATTVRTHLRRARERLRAQLDRGEGGRAAWVALLARPESGSSAGPALALGGALGAAKFAVACAVVFAFALGWRALDARRNSPRVEAVDVEVAQNEPASADPARAELARPAPVALPGDPTDSTSATRTAAAPAPGWWLVGAIDGPPDEDPARAHIELRTSAKRGETELEREPPVLSVAVGRGFALPLDALLASKPELHGLRARFDHPDYLPEERWIDLPSERALGSGERRELRVELALTKAAAIVEGSVRAPFAEPGADLCAALVRFDPRAQMPPKLVELARCDASGAFHLRAAVSGFHSLVAMELSAEPRSYLSTTSSRPETRLLDLVEDGRERLQLELGPGELLEGTVQETSGRPLGGAHVQARLLGGGRGLSLAGQSLAWLGDRFELASTTVQAREDGSFRIAGLAPSEYELSAIENRGRDRAAGVPWTGVSDARKDTLRVTAPARGISLSRSYRELRIEVSSAGVPVPSAELRMLYGDGESWSGTHTDESGRIDVRFDSAMEFEVRKPGYAKWRGRLPFDEPAPEGVIAVELEPGPAAASLVLALESASPEPGARLQIRLLPWAEGAERPDGARSVGADVLWHTCEWPRDGLVEMGELDPGRYLVHVSTPSFAREPARYVAPTEHVLFLPAGRHVVERVRLESGGSLVVDLPALPAGRESVAVTIRDAHGTELDVVFAGNRMLRLGRNESSGALAPGDYELVARIGRDELDPVPFTIEAGRETELALDLGD